jgi:hypothetical protein
VNFRRFPFLGNIVPRPAPDRDTKAAQIGQQERQIAADRLEPRQVDITKPSNVPFAWAAADILEIDIERATRA